jgi:hypothetical protein
VLLERFLTVLPLLFDPAHWQVESFGNFVMRVLILVEQQMQLGSKWYFPLALLMQPIPQQNPWSIGL